MSGTKNNRVVAGNGSFIVLTWQDGRAGPLSPHAFFYFALRIFFLRLCVLRRQCSSATLNGSWAPVSKRFYISIRSYLEDTTMNQANQRLVIISGHTRAITEGAFESPVLGTRVLAQLLIRFDGYIIHFLPTRRRRRRRRRIVSLRWGVLYRVLSQWKLRQERTRVLDVGDK